MVLIFKKYTLFKVQINVHKVQFMLHKVEYDFKNVKLNLSNNYSTFPNVVAIIFLNMVIS